MMKAMDVPALTPSSIPSAPTGDGAAVRQAPGQERRQVRGTFREALEQADRAAAAPAEPAPSPRPAPGGDPLAAPAPNIADAAAPAPASFVLPSTPPVPAQPETPLLDHGAPAAVPAQEAPATVVAPPAEPVPAMPMPAPALAMAQVGMASSVPTGGDPAARDAEPRKSAKGEDASAAPQTGADPAIVVPTPVTPLPPAVIADKATAAPDISVSPETAPAHRAHATAALAADAAADPSATAPETHLSAPLFTQTLEGATARHAALPYAVAEPAVTVREGRFGSDIGVTIARALDAGSGADGQAKGDLLIRLDPRHMGRVDVRLSFDHDGVMRAVVSADNPAALDLLRRESTDLGRALTDAGVRADDQSLRFDGGSGGSSAGNGGQSRPGASPGTGTANTAPGGDETPIHRPLKGSGHVDLMA